MSSISIPEKSRTHSFSDSFEISDISFAPAPPTHRHSRQQSLSSSADFRSTTSSSVFNGSVIWNKSSSQGAINYPHPSSRTSTPSEFGSSHASSMPLEFSSLESSGNSWSTSSSSFQTTSSAQTASSATLNNSTASKRPGHLGQPSTSRASYHRPSSETTYTSDPATNTGYQASTTLPQIPGYGPIRLTVTMDLPPPAAHLQQQQFLHTSSRIDTPINETSSFLQPETPLDSVIDNLSTTELRRLLRLAVDKYPSLATDIIHAQKPPSEHNKPLNFVHYSNSVWHTLNAKPTSSTNPSKTANLAIKTIATSITSIPTHLSTSSCLATKKNALETLRKIGRSVCHASGPVGQAVKEGVDACFVAACLEVVACFTREERYVLWAGGSGAEILRRFEQLDELRRREGVFEGFEGVVGGLRGEE